VFEKLNFKYWSVFIGNLVRNKGIVCIENRDINHISSFRTWFEWEISVWYKNTAVSIEYMTNLAFSQ
jgi:hypothetical protein